jgi:c-di-GMP-binding flagellar brake protein YcgR
MNGATIQGKDKYGLVDTTTINARAKIELDIFQQEKVFLFARVRSVIEADPDHDFTYLIGVEFEELEEWQEEIIIRIFNMRDKEHKMIWNLLDRNQEEVPS